VKISVPGLHPSVSKDSLLLIDTNDDEGGVVESVANPMLSAHHRTSSSSSKPPRMKQLQSIQLLVDQYNKHSASTNCNFLFVIEADWFNAWFVVEVRCVQRHLSVPRCHQQLEPD
jgi:hypothetical protein